MNNVVCVLFAPDGAGGGKAMNAADDGSIRPDGLLTNQWARLIAGDSVKILTGERTLSEVLAFIADSCKETASRSAVFSYSDCPLLDSALTEKLIDSHFKYSAEYTFADGYPYGLAGEVIDAGAAGILLELSRTLHKDMGDAPMTRTAIMDLLKTDINAFEVETVIAPHDWRLWRLAFYTGDKRARLACEKLLPYKQQGFNADALCEAAVKDINIVRTVPAFYELGLAGHGSIHAADDGALTGPGGGKFMPLDKVQDIAAQIKELSESAVVSLSAEGEPLEHPHFMEAVQALCLAGLDVLIETNGRQVTEETARLCKEAASGVKMMWVVKIVNSGQWFDTPPIGGTHQPRGDEGDEQAANGGARQPMDGTVAMLEKYFPGEVYPQLVRTKATEGMLEAFYRKWSAADSPSGGKVLIKKWCTYCGTLPDEKPCDLSPLERNPCWHLRRDMVILHDGVVPLCFARAHSLGDGSIHAADGGALTNHGANIAGNAFEERLSDIWARMAQAAEKDLNGERDDLCRECDEYYTFNF